MTIAAQPFRRPFRRLLLAAAVAAAAVPAWGQSVRDARDMRDEPLPEAGPFESWQIDPYIDVSLSYTDNALLAPDGAAEGDVFTNVAPGLRVRAVRPRYRATLDYSANMLHYFGTDELDDVVHRLNHASTSDLYEDEIFLDTVSVIRQEVIDPTISLTAREALAPRNATSIASTSISPYWLHRFGTLGEIEARYALRHVMPFDDAVANALRNTLSLRATTGERLSFLHLTGLLLHESTSISDSRLDRSTSRQLAEIDGAYDIGHYLSVLASLGFEAYDDRSSTVGNEPVYSIGARVRPGPNTSVSGRFRHRFERNFFVGDAWWRITPSLRLTALHNEELNNSQGIIADQLRRLSVDENGDMIDLTDLPFIVDENGQTINALAYLGLDMATDGFSLLDFAFNRRVSRAGLDWVLGRNRVHAVAFMEKRWTPVINYSQEVYGGSLRWVRDLSRVTRGIATAGYRHILFEHLGNREDDVYSAALQVDWRLSPGTTAYGEYDFLFSMPGNQLGDVTENVFTVGLRKTF